MALGRRETPLEQKAHQMCLHPSRIMNQHRLPVNSCKLHYNEAPHDPSNILFSRTWWRQLVSCWDSNQKSNGPRGLVSWGLETCSTLLWKRLSSYVLWRKVEPRPVTFAALPCPLLQHMGWQGGSSTRTAAPPPRRCGKKGSQRRDCTERR